MDQGQAAPQPQQAAPPAQPAAAVQPPVLPAPPPPLPVPPAPPAFALGPGRSHAVLHFDDLNTGAMATKLYNKVIAPLEAKFDGEADNLAVFLASVRDRARCFNWHRLITCRILGLPPSILFFNTSTGWFGRFVLSTECYRTRKLGYNNLNWPRCSARVTECLALQMKVSVKAKCFIF